MKLIQPQRLSVASRPYTWRGESKLAVALYVLIKFGNNGEYYLEFDQKLWASILPNLDSGGVLDHALPKAFPEYIISGYAYTAHQADKTRCMVKAEVAGLEKNLLVYGDRYWINNKISPCQPFEKMSLTWANAYGGYSYPKNTSGKGREQIIIDGLNCHPLPNIENPLAPVQHPTDHPEPAGYGGVGLSHPDRAAMQGSYSEDWFKYEFPGFPPDMNPSMFNMSADDQQWREETEIPMGEAFRLWNMHPKHHCWEGVIPDLRARCFLKQEDSKKCMIFKEVQDIRATTVWLLPEEDSAILMFHGTTSIQDDEAEDVKVIMGALEEPHSTKPATHYESVMELRSDPERSADYAEQDADLIPESLIRDLEEEDVITEKGRLSARLETFMASQIKTAEDQCSVIGVNFDEIMSDFVGPPEASSGLSTKADKERTDVVVSNFKDQLKKELKEIDDTNSSALKMIDEIESGINAAMSDKEPVIPHSGPPDLTNFQTTESIIAAGKGSANQSEKQQELLTDTTSMMRKSYLYTAQYQRPAARCTSDRNQAALMEVNKRYRDNKDLSKMDLTGVDLSGLDLEGADFTESFLENTLFDGAKLRNANFSYAVLTRATFLNAHINEATFSNANLAKSNIINSQLESCDFKDANIDGICLEGSTFSHCDYSGLMAENVKITDCRLVDCLFGMAMLDDASMQSVSFEGCSFKKLAFTNVSLQKCDFYRMQIKDFYLSESQMYSCQFRESNIENMLIEEDVEATACQFVFSSLNSCTFIEAVLNATVFYGSDLQDSDFTETVLQDCVFDFTNARDTIFRKADLKRSSFKNANLIEASFEKAQLEGCDFNNATLFRTNFSKVTIDRDTKLDGAYKDQLALYPMYRDAIDIEALFK